MVFSIVEGEESEEGVTDIDLEERLAAENGFLPTLSEGCLLSSDNTQRGGEWRLDLYFRETNSSGLSTGANVLTDGYMKEIREVEKRIANLPQMENLCFKAQEGICRRPVSFTNFVFGTMKSIEQTDVGIHQVDKEIFLFGTAVSPLPVAMVAAKFAEKGGTWYFGQDFNGSHRKSAVVRSRFYFGLPLKGFESRQDRYDEQQYLFQTWASDVLLPYLETASSERLQVIYAEDYIRTEEIRKVVVSDGTYAFGSSAFIIAVSAYQMESLAVPLGGVVTIAMSLPLAFATFRLLYDRFSIINIKYCRVLPDPWHWCG